MKNFLEIIKAKMQMNLSIPRQTKYGVFAIALVSIIMFSSFFVAAAPIANANLRMPDRDTQTQVAVSPKLVGLGQTVLINVLTYPGPSGPTYYAQDLINVYPSSFVNISVTMTKPDGTKETSMPIDITLSHIGVNVPGAQQIVGSLMYEYTPTQIGNYSLTASFPGQMFNSNRTYAGSNMTVYYKPSSSWEPETFTVQKDPVLGGILNGWPWLPNPNGYWENPVSTNNRDMYSISGDWLQPGYDYLASRYNPYSTAPSSPHILWSNTVGMAGLAGGIWGSQPYATISTGGANVILNGKIYQNSPKAGYFDCVDLRTGQVLWSASGSITCAQRIDPPYQTSAQVNEGGLAAWLWGFSGTNWIRYNPFTGDVLQTITNAPSTSEVQTRAFQDGSPLCFLNQANMATWNTTIPLHLSYSNLLCWNYSKMITTVGYSQITSNDWRNGIEWNVSLNNPSDVVNLGDHGLPNGVEIVPFPEANVIVCKTPNDMQLLVGYDYTTGKKIWENNATVLNNGVRAPFVASSTGPILIHDGASPTLVGYDVYTGKEKYRVSTGELPWGMLPDYSMVTNFEKRFFYTGSFDGHVYAYNADTGKLVWKSDYVGAEDESIYGNQPFLGATAGADGILYFQTATVYSLTPRTRFHYLIAMNETTGHFMWKLPMGSNQASMTRAVVNGYMVTLDNENGIQYCFGKGKTETSVFIQNDVIVSGASTLIKGKVMDLSPGQPNTPAVSDVNMSVWMDYLHMQNTTLINDPPKPNGVTVKLSATDTNGNTIPIGEATSNYDGAFQYEWKPTASGVYTIYAEFQGSQSYWSSSAATGLAVDSPITPTASQTPPASQVSASPDMLMAIVGVGIAMIIAVAVATVLILRKR